MPEEVSSIPTPLNGYKVRESIERRIREEGKNLGNGILDVATFINHQVDPELIEGAAWKLALKFCHIPVTKVVTAETSGIPLALVMAGILGAQMIYARKIKPITLGDCFTATVLSRTKNTISDLVIAKKALNHHDQVLIVDDFLARGNTAEALANLIRPTTIVGFAFLVEKSFEGGRILLERFGVPIVSLVKITDMSGGEITFGNSD